MTIDEASRRYNIPVKILREYESWGLCGEVKKVMGSWRYDDSDIERLSIIMTLHDKRTHRHGLFRGGGSFRNNKISFEHVDFFTYCTATFSIIILFLILIFIEYINIRNREGITNSI